MKDAFMYDLLASVQDRTAFTQLADYNRLTQAFLKHLQSTKATRIISPNVRTYIFYQYPEEMSSRITRPLNVSLFFESADEFKEAFEQTVYFLADLRRQRTSIATNRAYQDYIKDNVVSRVVYTMQQCIGCIGDAFENPNQSRKRIGQLFEALVRLIIRDIGLTCEPRRVLLPIPGFDGYTMSYELDLVFSENRAILTSETVFIHPHEIVGSVKTTSKDRIDKVFLDKYLLAKLLGRDIRVVAVFLHDVQRAQHGTSLFGVNSTFKSNHFLGYTVALNRLDGVYYVDPRPEMFSNVRLREQIHNFQEFLLADIWELITSS